MADYTEVSYEGTEEVVEEKKTFMTKVKEFASKKIVKIAAIAAVGVTGVLVVISKLAKDDSDEATAVDSEAEETVTIEGLE